MHFSDFCLLSCGILILIPWQWRKHVLLKCWQPPARCHSPEDHNLNMYKNLNFHKNAHCVYMQVLLKHSYMEISSCGMSVSIPNHFSYIAGWVSQHISPLTELMFGNYCKKKRIIEVLYNSKNFFWSFRFQVNQILLNWNDCLVCLVVSKCCHSKNPYLEQRKSITWS